MPQPNRGFFDRFAKTIATASGRPITFGAAVLLIIAWGVTGPLFGFSDTWQLVINTSTTIITFLMVFLIQNTQNRDSHALQLKIDELIRATEGAHVALMDIEELSEEELCKIQKAYALLASQGHEELRKGSDDTKTPALDTGIFESKP